MTNEDIQSEEKKIQSVLIVDGAELMKRVFAEDGSSFVNCGGRLELRVVVICPPVTVKVLAALVGEGFGRDPSELE